MFGWFAPKCPLELDQKVWTEYRMRWLADLLGIDRLLKAEVIIPTADFFPAIPAKTEEVVNGLMRLLESYLGISEPVPFKLLTGNELTEATDEEFKGLLIPEQALDNPSVLATKILRQLAQIDLMRRGCANALANELEGVADLLLIFVGSGLIAVNNNVVDKTHRIGEFGYWEISKNCHLTSNDFGYALALFAYVRNEEAPAWMTHLNADAAETMKKGLQFLHKTNDSLFRPDRLRDRIRPPIATEACDRLRSGTPTEQVFTLWQLEKNPLSEPAVIEAIEEKLAERNWVIASSAADALGPPRDASRQAIPALLRALNSSYPRVRAAAANTLGEIQAEPELVIPALVYHLTDSNARVLTAAGFALGKFGSAAQEHSPTLVRAIDSLLYGQSTESNVAFLLVALTRIEPDAETHLRAFYEGGNDEHLEHLMGMLAEMRATATTS